MLPAAEQSKSRSVKEMSSATRRSSGRDPRFALRDETSQAHAALDQLYSRLKLDQPGDYGVFLQSHAAAFIPVEDALLAAGAETLTPGWAARRRAPALRDDLHRMELEIPAPGEPPAFEDEAEVLGGMYVLEGSRLGGAVLVRSVGPGLPTRFLSPGDPAQWRAFQALLRERLTTDAHVLRAGDAARAVFALFEWAVRTT